MTLDVTDNERVNKVEIKYFDTIPVGMAPFDPRGEARGERREARGGPWLTLTLNLTLTLILTLTPCTEPPILSAFL